ncbi:MAG: DUF4336 domain-containing protein [bacterium]|nr:DUF4336 domain-containing protein [bacterium]
MLRSLDRGLWVIDHPLKIGIAEFGTRTTVIRLRDGSLFVHSPGPLSAALRQALSTLGPVKFVVAPNKVHHFFVAENMRSYPDAQLHLAPGLAEKISDLPKGQTLNDEAPEGWASDLDQIWVRGSDFLEEVVFLHPATRTLVLTDLAFNFHGAETRTTRIFLRLVGAYKRFGPSRIARVSMRDKKAIRAGIDRILEWDFDRVIVTHGDVLETGGRQALREAYARIG